MFPSVFFISNAKQVQRKRLYNVLWYPYLFIHFSKLGANASVVLGHGICYYLFYFLKSWKTEVLKKSGDIRIKKKSV